MKKDQTTQEIARLLNGLPPSEREEILAGVEKLIKEPTPEEIKNTQVSRLISLGFPKALGMSNDEFVKAVPLPIEGKTGHVLVINLKYVSIPTAMSLIEVDGKHGKNYLNLDLLEDIASAPKGMFYWRYGLDFKTCHGKSPADSLKLILKANRIPGTSNDAIYVVAQMPQLLKEIWLDCPGSRYRRDYAPFLYLYDDGPGLDAISADDAGPDCGSFSFGSDS